MLIWIAVLVYACFASWRAAKYMKWFISNNPDLGIKPVWNIPFLGPVLPARIFGFSLCFVIVLIILPLKEGYKCMRRCASNPERKRRALAELMYAREAETAEKLKRAQEAKWRKTHKIVLYYNNMRGVYSVLSERAHDFVADQHRRAVRNGTARHHKFMPLASGTHTYAHTSAGVPEEYLCGYLSDFDDLKLPFVELRKDPKIFVAYASSDILSFQEQRKLIFLRNGDQDIKWRATRSNRELLKWDYPPECYYLQKIPAADEKTTTACAM